MALFRKNARKTQPASRDRDRLVPVIRCSICTGEQVAGFQREDGTMEEVMLLNNPEDLLSFRREYGIAGEIRKIY